MACRFLWNHDRDRVLSGLWLTTDPDMIAVAIGCATRSVYKRAVELNLGPRDKVQRALWLGERPHDRSVITLPVVNLPPEPADEIGFGATADGPARRAAGGGVVLPGASAGKQRAVAR